MPSDCAVAWSCVAWRGVWLFPVAAASDQQETIRLLCCKSSLRGELGCCSLPVSGIIVFHNWVSFWNVPYLTLRSLWTVLPETLLLPVFLLWSGKTPASFQCCNTRAAFQTAVKEVYLWVFFFRSDFSVCNSLIFYLTHKTFRLGCCPVFLFLLLLLETEYIQQLH